MKSRQDIESRLLLELQIWFGNQIREDYKDYYLYYLESTAEHDSGLFIAEHKPANQGYVLAMPEQICKFSTIQQNFTRILPVLMKLPILDKESK